MRRNRDYFVLVERKEEKHCCSAPSDYYNIYFAIRFTGAQIDQIAHNHQVKADLDVGMLSMHFNKHMHKSFVCFDAR